MLNFKREKYVYVVIVYTYVYFFTELKWKIRISEILEFVLFI